MSRERERKKKKPIHTKKHRKQQTSFRIYGSKTNDGETSVKD